MIKIQPFLAMRPVSCYAKQIAALPYDVVTDEEAVIEMQEKPYSFLNVDKAKTAQEAKGYLEWMIEEGVYETEQVARFYLYGLQDDTHEQYGIVGCFSCDDYDKGLIKKHEKTRQDKEDERIQHVATCKAQTGPIFLAYKQQEWLDGLVSYYKGYKKPLYDFTDETGLHQIVYQIEVQDNAKITRAFEQMDALYIADGHHRAAAACSYARNPKYLGEEKKYFLGVAFPKDQLEIIDYNRVVTLDNPINEKMYFEAIEKVFDVEAVEEVVFKPTQKGMFGMRYHQKWYALTLKEGYKVIDPVEGLDVAVLQKYILQPLFGIKEPRTDKRLDFVGGVRGIEMLNAMSQDPNQIAFSMFPTSFDEIIAVADRDGLMPPKSTWFEPKLRSGLFIHHI